MITPNETHRQNPLAQSCKINWISHSLVTSDSPEADASCAQFVNRHCPILIWSNMCSNNDVIEPWGQYITRDGSDSAKTAHQYVAPHSTCQIKISQADFLKPWKTCQIWTSAKMSTRLLNHPLNKQTRLRASTGISLFAWPNSSWIQYSDVNVTVQDSHISHCSFRTICKPYFVPEFVLNPRSTTHHPSSP